MAKCTTCDDVRAVRSERGVWDRCPACRPLWEPGDLCSLGGRSAFKVGYVVGPSKRLGKTRVKSFSANTRSFSNVFAVADELVLPLPAYDNRSARHTATIRLAVLASAGERTDLRRGK